MNWILWIVVVWMVFSALAVVAGIGKEREPIRSSTAVAALIIQGALIALIVWGASID